MSRCSSCAKRSCKRSRLRSTSLGAFIPLVTCQISTWREHVQRLASAAGNSVRRAVLLEEALGGRAVDSAEMLELCKAAGALKANGAKRVLSAPGLEEKT